LPFRLPPHCVWTVVDTYQVDGAQYVVVRRDQIPRCAPPALSRRESQALKLAAHGHTNKAIAFEMGASASTVGVFLYRAARKLGSRTRAELLACFLGQPANEVSPGGGGSPQP
jgi:DNA-binding NarL/FixJ family response regulator